MSNALVIIDAQRYFINDFTKGIPEKIAKVTENGFDFIIFLKFVNAEASNFSKDLNWKKMFSSPEIDITPELEKLAKKSIVFSKTSFSAFRSKEFANFIRKNKVDTLFICGFDTDGCVLSTALEAFDLGYSVRVLEDLCASHHGIDIHKSAISIMKRNAWSMIINSNELHI
jgi:nicotinamidase-related amidase